MVEPTLPQRAYRNPFRSQRMQSESEPDSDQRESSPRRDKERTGFDFALTESTSTKNDNTFLRLREVQVNGKTFQTLTHAKYGSRPKWARMYLAADSDAKKLVVGHCGDHLDTAGTGRKR